MKKQLFLLISIIISIVLTVPAFAAVIPEDVQRQAESLELDAESAILIDALTGDILYQKEIDKKQFPASITKLMTILLALENCPDLDETIEFSHDAVFSIEPGSSHIAIDAGEKITVRQALYAIILQSANEVSNGVAEHIDGSMEEFAKHMTSRAKELGCKNTNFVNANGLHDENHYTTAYDMSLIAKELLKFDFFRELIGTTYYEIPPTNKQPETRYLYGQNQLIKPSSAFYYDYCEGGKTGFTNEAGNTLVAYAKQGNTELISVVLKSTGYGEYTDTAKLFDFGFNNFETVNLASAGDSAGSVNVNEERKKETVTLGIVNAVFEENISATVTKSLTGSIETLYSIPEDINAPVSNGQFLGTAIYRIGSDDIAKVNLISDSSIMLTENSIQNAGQNTVNFKTASILLAAAVILIIAVKIILNKIAHERRKRKRRERIKRYRQTYGNIDK